MLAPLGSTTAAPFSTGQHPRSCRVCGTSFVGLGDLCPIHLPAVARTRAFELQTARTQSNSILAVREAQARAARPARVEVPDELDA